MSKDSPTSYHARTVTEFIKSYLQGEDALNEAADVAFSANNLHHHSITVPHFIYNVHSHLEKARIAEFEPSRLGEQTQMLTGRASQYALGKKHPQRGIEIFNGDQWRASKDDPALRRKLLERAYAAQFQTVPRAGTPADAEPHPIHDINMFHTSRGSPTSSASSPMITMFVTSLIDRTDGVTNYKAMDRAMSDLQLDPITMGKKQNMGKWTGAQGDASWTKQVKDLKRRFKKEYLSKYSSPIRVSADRIKRIAEARGIDESEVERRLQEDAYMRQAVQFKMWELRGIPRDEIWKTKTDEDGLKTGEQYKQATKTLKSKTTNPQNAQRVCGFLPFYLGLPLLEYEDALKVLEWFFDGAGNSGEGTHEHHYDDSVINKILGNNARGWLTRHTQGFANALHGIYSGEVSTSGHNTLVGGDRGINKQAQRRVFQDTYQQLMGHSKYRGRSFKDVMEDYLNVDLEQLNDVLGATESEDGVSILNKLGGKLDEVPTDFEQLEGVLGEEDTKEAMKAIAIGLGPRGSTYDHNDFLNNIKHIYKLKDNNFDPYKGLPEFDKTLLYYYAHALGATEGAMGNDWTHLQDLLDEQFPMVFTSRKGADESYLESVTQEGGVGSQLTDLSQLSAEERGSETEERVLPSPFRAGGRADEGLRTTYRPKAKQTTRKDGTIVENKWMPTMYEHSFKLDESADPITQAGQKKDLRRALREAGYGEQEEEELLADYEDGKTIKVEVNQGDFDQTGFVQDVLGDMDADEYLEYDSFVNPLTLGQSALVTPLLAHTPHSDRNPNHFTADFLNGESMRQSPHGSPMNTILATRDLAINFGKHGGQRMDRRTEGQSLRRDRRGRERDNEESYSSSIDNNEAHNRALILATLLYQKHHSITDYDETHHDSHNRKQIAEDMSDVYRENHLDPFGRNHSRIYSNELLGAEIPDSIAIYDKEEYEKAIENSKKQGAILELPTPLKDNIENREQLKNQLTAQEGTGNTSFHHNEAGVPFHQLGLSQRGREQQRMIQGSDFVGQYEDGEGNLRKYVIRRTPMSEYQDRMRELRQMSQVAYENGDKERGDLLVAQSQNQANHIADELGDEPPITSDELRDDYLRDARDMHQHALSMSRLLRPLVMWANPNVFQHHDDAANNQAWADTKMFAHMCETFARSLPPEDRVKFLMSGRVTSSKDGGSSMKVVDILEDSLRAQGMSDKAIESEIEDIKRDLQRQYTRKTWQGARRDRQHDEFGKDGNMSVLALMEKFVNGELDKIPQIEKVRGIVDRQNLVKQIFEKVRADLPSNASNESVLRALHARYVPHDDVGSNLTQEMTAESLMEFGQGSRGVKNGKEVFTPYNYRKLSGGHHHENELNGQPTMSGGEAVLNSAGKPINMEEELRAIAQVFQHLEKETRGTSHGISGRLTDMQFLGGKKARKGTSWYRGFPQKFDTFLDILAGDTQAKRRVVSQLNDKNKVAVGGLDPQTQQFPAVHTCRSINKKFGRVMRPSYTYRTHNLKHNTLIFDNEDLDVHHGRSEHTMAMDPYGLRDFNANLRPYNPQADMNPNTAPVAVSQGANVNTNLSVFAGVNSGEELLRAFDYLTDDTLVFKEDGRPVPIKAMHRIYDFSDLKHLRGFSGDWVVSHIPDGEPVIVQKEGKKTKAYNSDMENVELTKDILDEMGKVHEKDFVVHAVFGEDMLYIIDILVAVDEKTHNMPAKDRVRHLRAKFESSEHIKLPEPYNTKRADDEGLEEAVSLLRDEAPTDILLRDAEGTYMRGELRHPKWIVLSKEKKVDVIILDRKGTNYRIGVGPIMHPEHYGSRAVEHDGEHYMDVGHAKGPRGFDKGEYVSVLCTGASRSGDENPTYKIRSARIDNNAHPQAADSVESLDMLVGEAKVPHKVRLNKGNIHVIFPALGDEVIYKTERVDGGWFIEPTSTIWGYGEEYLIKLAEDMRPHWELFASALLKEKMVEEDDDDDDEVEPEAPAGHTKERKKILPEEEEVIKRGLGLIERGLEHLTKEKITHTGVEGLGIDYAGADVESPRGPTENINDDTMPDYDPASRDYKESPAKTKKKKTRIRTTAGEEGVTDNEGNVTITQARN